MWETSFDFNYFTQYKCLLFYTFIAYMMDEILYAKRIILMTEPKT